MSFLPPALVVTLLLAACNDGAEPFVEGDSGPAPSAPEAFSPPERVAEGGGGEQGDEGAREDPLDDSAVGETPEDPLRALEKRVVTGFIDAANHESWICLGRERRAEYRLRIGDDGERRGRELDGSGAVTGRLFGWAAIDVDTLLFDYRETGRQVEIASILFSGDDAFRASDSVDGPLECRRQRYLEAVPMRDVSSLDVPADVDPEAEAATALAARIETRDESRVTLEYWHCDVSDGASVDYVFAAAGVLAAEPRALELGEGGEREGGRAFRWVATDGATLVLVPEDKDVAGGEGEVAPLTLGAIVFPVEGVFTAVRDDGRTLQCLARKRDP